MRYLHVACSLAGVHGCISLPGLLSLFVCWWFGLACVTCELTPLEIAKVLNKLQNKWSFIFVLLIIFYKHFLINQLNMSKIHIAVNTIINFEFDFSYASSKLLYRKMPVSLFILCSTRLSKESHTLKTSVNLSIGKKHKLPT